MDQLQQTELEQRQIERSMSNRITALTMAMEINGEENDTELIIKEAKDILAFIEEKFS